MLEEEWRPIPEFKGAYEVSDRGRIRSVTKRGDKIRKLSERNLQGRKFQCVHLNRNVAKARFMFIHRIVAEAFLPLPSELSPEPLIVRHKDRNTLNNSKDNLEWAVKRLRTSTWKLITEAGTEEIIVGLEEVGKKLNISKVYVSHLVFFSKQFPNMLPRIERC